MPEDPNRGPEVCQSGHVRATRGVCRALASFICLSRVAEEIRKEPLDGPAGRALVAGFESEVTELYPFWDATLGPSAEPEEFEPPNGVFLVAYDGEHPVACGGLKRLDDWTAEIKRMYVVPENRGRGLARRMLERLEDEARDGGYGFVRLDTGDRQPHALALYRSAGYREIPDYNGNPAATHWFEKGLV